MRQMAEGAKAINQTLAGTNKRMTKMEYEVKESRMEAKVARDENQSNKWTLLHVTTTDSQITRKVSELNSNIALDNWNLLHMRTTSLHFTSLHFTSLFAPNKRRSDLAHLQRSSPLKPSTLKPCTPKLLRTIPPSQIPHSFPESRQSTCLRHHPKTYPAR